MTKSKYAGMKLGSVDDKQLGDAVRKIVKEELTVALGLRDLTAEAIAEEKAVEDRLLAIEHAIDALQMEVATLKARQVGG